MRKILTYLLPILMVLQTTSSFAGGRIQNEDVKSLSDITAAVLTTTGNLTSTSVCIASPASVAGVTAGLFVYDTTHSTYIPSGTTVVGVPGTCSAGQIQMSAAAAGTATGDTITFGGQASRLINDTKIWASSVTPTQTLASAISTGAIGGTAGTKNYLTTYKGNAGNGNFEFGNTNGWSLGTIATLTNGLPTGTPTFGSGANANLSISAVSSGAIAGNYSLSYASSTSDTLGNMVASSSFAIDTEDQAKVMGVKFYYSLTSGASAANFSGTSSNSFAWAAYDVTNSVWLPSTGNFCMTQNSGAGYCTGTVQTGASTANVRFVVYNSTLTTGATTLLMDDFFFGPQTAPFGPAMTDWVPYTPTITGFGTPTAVTFFSRRVGSNLEVSGYFTSGTSTAVQAQVTLGYNGGNANVTASGSTAIGSLGAVEGVGAYSGTAAGATFYPIALQNANYLVFGLSSSGSVGFNGLNGSALLSSGQTFSFHASVPITGWSSNSSMSSDTDTRVVAATIAQTASYSTTAGSPIILASPVVTDTHGAYNTATGQYTIPVTGWYQFSISGRPTAAVTMWLNLAGSALANMGALGIAAASNPPASTVQYLNAGSVITFVPDTSTTLNYTAYSGTTTGFKTLITINRLSGPSVIAATESVNASYNTSSTTVGTTPTVLVATNKLFDSHNAYSTSTGLYTCPVSGKFRISGSYIGSAVTANAINQGVQALIQKNGTTVSQAYTLIYQQTSTAVNPTGSLSATIACNAGDTIGFALQRDSGVNSFAVQSTASFTNISIERVGN